MLAFKIVGEAARFGGTRDPEETRERLMSLFGVMIGKMRPNGEQHVLGHGLLASRSGQLFSDESFSGLSIDVEHVGAAVCHSSGRSVVCWRTAGARSPLGRYFASRYAGSWPLATKILPSPADDSVM